MTSIERDDLPGHSATPTDDLRSAARHEYDDARDRIAGQTDRLRHEGGATIKTAVTDELDRRKAGIGAEIRTLAETLRHAADEQSQKAATGVGAAPSSLLGHGAGLLEDLGAGLEGRSVNDITRSVSDYARNNPALFIGGCILAGLAVGRLLTATEQRGTPAQTAYRPADQGGLGGDQPPYRPQTQGYAQAQSRQPGTEPPVFGTPRSPATPPLATHREGDNGTA